MPMFYLSPEVSGRDFHCGSRILQGLQRYAETEDIISLEMSVSSNANGILEEYKATRVIGNPYFKGCVYHIL